jgi:hypothetical protein
MYLNTAEAAQTSVPGPSLVNSPSFAIGFSRVAKTALFHALEIVVLEATPERNGP